MLFKAIALVVIAITIPLNSTLPSCTLFPSFMPTWTTLQHRKRPMIILFVKRHWDDREMSSKAYELWGIWCDAKRMIRHNRTYRCMFIVRQKMICLWKDEQTVEVIDLQSAYCQRVRKNVNIMRFRGSFAFLCAWPSSYISRCCVF